MIDYSQPSFCEIRGYNKFSLETFVDHLSNPFEPVVDKLIDSHWKRIKALREMESQLESKITKNKKPEVLHELLLKQINVIGERTWLNDEIIALTEMKIIYAFKFFETKLKRLLIASMEIVSTKEWRSWEAIKSFLETKNIGVEGLNGHNEINQFREVNNAIKHSDDYNERLKNIPEFSSPEMDTFHSLQEFYNRVKNAPTDFLHDLCSAISSELYDFDLDKIKKIGPRHRL